MATEGITEPQGKVPARGTERIPSLIAQHCFSLLHATCQPLPHPAENVIGRVQISTP